MKLPGNGGRLFGSVVCVAAAKTCISQSLSEVEYLDCELPRVRRLFEDPDGFLKGLGARRLIVDEIHRLNNASEVLKIAADHFPLVKVLATGSSTLGASTRFRDTLAGRKVNIWLTPMLSGDLNDFGLPDLRRRLVQGGLPPFFLAEQSRDHDFSEWMDAFWSRDIQELFRLERRHSFLRFIELLIAQSGGIFEATRFAAPCEVSRTTISNYLSVLEETYVMHVIRPFTTRMAVEITTAPKVFAFDTGFITYFRDWRDVRQEDMGVLWEHYVLNELCGRLQTRKINYWRDKQHHEVDFILASGKRAPIAIECKWSVRNFDPSNLQVFRRQYPKGDNLVVCQDVEQSFERSYRELAVKFVNLTRLIEEVS